MKQKNSTVTTVSTVTGGFGMQPVGPSIGYGETHTFVMNDAQGHSTRLITDLPMKNIPMDDKEMTRLWDTIVKSPKAIEEVNDVNDLKKKLADTSKARFDDDGSDWL